MTDTNLLSLAIRELADLINSAALEPSRDRRDWSKQREPIRAALEILEKRILEPLGSELKVASEEDREAMRHVVASLTGAVAAVLLLSGDRHSASSLLSRACAAAGDTDARLELEAATHDTDAFVRLSHARWLRRNGKARRAEKVLEQVIKATRDPKLREIATSLLQAPSPLQSAPSLATVNGCGISMYGKRDPWPDGSYVATTFLTLVFVPLFPLAAYRVLDQGGNSYLFLGRVPLWKPLRWFRRGVSLAVLAGIAALVVNAWLESPSRRAGLALQSARAAEQAGRSEEALAAYSQAVADFGFS
ncbi:MAG: hypothetical protein HY901_15165, partial [Deltaproteobacteria bacterium]|nr:hypothetical protein [Deltaproteobacteria bacterium]